MSAWGEDSCEIYYHNGDGVSMVKNGETLPELQQEEGSTIDCNALDLTLAMANGSGGDGETVTSESKHAPSLALGAAPDQWRE